MVFNFLCIPDGYNDNGSGVATLLELARVIVESRCKPKNSIIFVAFDLEEMGAQVRRSKLPNDLSQIISWIMIPG